LPSKHEWHVHKSVHGMATPCTLYTTKNVRLVIKIDLIKSDMGMDIEKQFNTKDWFWLQRLGFLVTTMGKCFISHKHLSYISYQLDQTH
jgi:hypothetical protein